MKMIKGFTNFIYGIMCVVLPLLCAFFAEFDMLLFALKGHHYAPWYIALRLFIAIGVFFVVEKALIFLADRREIKR